MFLKNKNIIFLIFFFMLTGCKSYEVDVSPKIYGGVNGLDVLYIQNVKIVPPSLESEIKDHFCRNMEFSLIKENISVNSYLSESGQKINYRYRAEVNIYYTDGNLMKDTSDTFSIMIYIIDQESKHSVMEISLIGYGDIRLADVQKESTQKIAKAFSSSIYN